MTWPKAMPVVEVSWIDSQFHGSGWRSKAEMDEFAADDLGCRSVGYLYLDTEDRLILVQDTSSTGEVAHITTIPRPAVRSMRVIEPALPPNQPNSE